MGYSLSWFAIKGKMPESILAEMGLRPTGVHLDSANDERDSGAPLPGGWYLINRNRHEYKDSVLRKLSKGADVVAFFIEEHVMVSKAAAWHDGREIWSVVHDAEKGLRHLESRGQLPAEFSSIRNRLLADQESESEDCDHVIEIPYELAATATDYEHDAAMEELRFEALKKISFFARLF